MIREVFRIPEDDDIKKAAIEILDRLHTMAVAFTDFTGYSFVLAAPNSVFRSRRAVSLSARVAAVLTKCLKTTLS